MRKNHLFRNICGFGLGILLIVGVSQGAFAQETTTNVPSNNAETSTSATAQLTEKEYAISAIDLKVNVPTDLYVLTRNVSTGSKALELLQADAVSLQNSYIQNNVYLNAFPEELNYEIIVSSTAINNSSAVNFNELPMTEFDEYTKRIREEFEASQHDELLELSIYENANGRYVFTSTHSNLNDTSTYVVRYYTVMNGHNYNYTLQTDGTEIDEAMLAKITSIVDSAQYEKVRASITESALFMELWETFVGFGITVLVLGIIIFLMIRSTKVKH